MLSNGDVLEPNGFVIYGSNTLTVGKTLEILALTQSNQLLGIVVQPYFISTEADPNYHVPACIPHEDAKPVTIVFEV